MSKLKIDKHNERFFKKHQHSQVALDKVKEIGIVEYVRQYPCAIIAIYCFCRALDLSQEEFDAARQEQINRLTKSLQALEAGFK